MLLELSGYDDSDEATTEQFTYLSYLPVHTLGLNKCSLSKSETQTIFLRDAVRLLIKDSYLNFSINYPLPTQEVYIQSSTIGLSSSLGSPTKQPEFFSSVKKFYITGSTLKSP